MIPGVLGRVIRRLPLAALVALALPGAASAQAQVVYVNTTDVPEGGVLLPGTPTTIETVHVLNSLGTIFDNECYPSSYSGPSSIDLDETTNTIAVDFDASGATSSPTCPSFFAPVSYARVDLGPLPAGHWTLQIGTLLSAYPLGSIAPQTIEFDVVETPPVPIAGPFALPLLLGGALLVGARRIGEARKA